MIPVYVAVGSLFAVAIAAWVLRSRFASVVEAYREEQRENEAATERARVARERERINADAAQDLMAASDPVGRADRLRGLLDDNGSGSSEPTGSA